MNNLKSKNATRKPLSFFRYIMAAMSFLALACGTILTNAQTFDWAFSIGGTHYDATYAVAVDGEGNVYVTGNFRNSADFDPGPGSTILTAMGTGTDIYLTKYDRNGSYVWAISIGSGTRDNGGHSIALDKSNNIYIIGSFSGTADFDPGRGVANLSSGIRTMFIAKYNSNGNYLWAKNVETTGEIYGKSVAVDGNGNAYITGSFMYTVDFDPGPGLAILSTSGTYNDFDAFIAKYNNNGDYVWAGRMGNIYSDGGNGVTVDKTGNIYVTGSFGGTVDFDIGSGVANLTSVGAWGAFIAKYDSSGSYIWANSSGEKGEAAGLGIALDDSENIHITGLFQDTVDFDPGAGSFNLTGNKAIDSSLYGWLWAAFEVNGSTIFFAKYDSAGNFVWAKKIENNSLIGMEDRGVSAAVDKSGNLYITGFFTGTADFDPGPGKANLTNSNGYDWASFPAFVPGNPFIAKYDPEGNYIWAGSIECSHNAEGNGIAVDGNGNVYAVGSFHGTADFDPGADTAILYTNRSTNEVANGVSDGYILKLTCSDTSSYYFTVSTCRESYTLNGEVYTTTGTYPQVFPNTLGCDSTVMLDLTFYELEPVITIEVDTLSTTESYSTYQWYKNDTLIPGATNRKYTITENADYQVVVTNENGCTGTSETYIVTNHGVSIDDINKLGEQINIYPNPIENILYINSPVGINAILTSLDGRTIVMQQNAKQLILKNLSAGVYFLRLSDSEGRLIKVEKIVKE